MSSPQRIDDRPTPPERPADAHKGHFGRALIVAGSEGLSGAACLAGFGALRGGVGLLWLGVPRCIAPIVAAVESSWMTLWLNDAEGCLDGAALPVLEESLEGKNVLAIGPGLGRTPVVRDLVQSLYARAAVPLVLDADGLDAFSEEASKLRSRTTPAARVLTPHAGEFARLTGLGVDASESRREESALRFASDNRVTLLLKGPRTVITDGERLAVNTTGGEALATGGSGDVLTGLITALLAQGLDAFDAARLGAWVHGLAGEVAGERWTSRAACASDIHASIPDAWRRLESDC